MRLLSDVEILELVDNMKAEGGIDRFMVNRVDVIDLIKDAIDRELAAQSADVKYDASDEAEPPTAEELARQDIFDAVRLGAEAAAIEEGIRRLRTALAPEATYSGRSVRLLLAEHPLSAKLYHRLAEIDAELIGKI